MIAEAIIGSVTSIILGSLWLAHKITARVMDKEAKDEEADRRAKDPKPDYKERVYPFVAPTGQPCHLCGREPGSGKDTKISRTYENGYLRRECANCKGSYLMELATPPAAKTKTI